jgi:hypothetical protein
VTVAGPLTILYVTGSPDEAVAFSVKGASPKVLFGMAGKVIVCGSLFTITVRLTTELRTGEPLSVAVRVMVWVPVLQAAPVMLIFTVDTLPLVILVVTLHNPRC